MWNAPSSNEPWDFSWRLDYAAQRTKCLATVIVGGAIYLTLRLRRRQESTLVTPQS